MNLRDLCEPLFLEVCRLNRLARKGGGAGAELTRDRARVVKIFDSMKARASEDVALINQYEQIEPVLVYFVDHMLGRSQLPYAAEWPPLELEKYDDLVGEQRFFELLDQTLGDPSPAAVDRLEVFYTCLGLGFCGIHEGDPQTLRRKQQEIQVRIRDRVEPQRLVRLTSDRDLNVDDRVLFEPAGKLLMVMGIVLAGLIVILVLGNYILFFESQKKLEAHLDTIIDRTTKETASPAD